jgi:hypothetical protein
MRKERKVLDKIVAGRVPSITNARTFVNHGKRIGIEMGAMEALQLFRKAMLGGKIRRDEKETQ